MALTGSTNEEKIWNFLYAKFGNGYGVAGLMGNLYAESGLNPENLQNSYETKLCYTDKTYTAAVDNGSYTNFVKDSAGYGIAQWTYWSRKQNLISYVQSKGVSIGDLETQLEFLYQEISSGYTAVLSALKNASSVRSASDIVLMKYEQPADQSEMVKAKRAGYGQTYYNKYSDASASTEGGNTMSVLIGHASISETGGINGAAGDSTGKEVCTRSWYSKPWDFMAIHPDATVREKHAKAIEQACANDNIGYSQYGTSNRNTLNTLAKSVNYDLSKVGKCNCDCSSLQNVAAVASGASGVTYGSNGWTTSTMKAALTAAGYKIITDSTYLTSEDYCVRGAIYVKASSHTVCGLTNGSKANQTLSKAGITSSSGTSSGNTSYSGKGIGTATAKVDMNIRSGAGTNYSSYGTISKGTAVEVLEILSSGWYKIVWPGASCGYAYTSNVSGKYYTYVANSASGSSSSVPTYKVGNIYTLQVELKVRSGAGTNNSAKSNSQLTTDGQKHDSDKDGALDKGTKVTCQEVKTVGSDIWIRCPSGWLAAYYQGNIYIK